jgi:hypothetical protein
MVDLAVGSLGFLFGLLAGLAVWGLLAPKVADVGPLGFLLLPTPLALTPFTYVFGFFLQEATLPQRSRRAQLVSSIACGAGVVVLLVLLIVLCDFIERFLEVPQWLMVAAVVALVLVGPAGVAVVSAWIERRISGRRAAAPPGRAGGSNRASAAKSSRR